jgi:hypothetical protein
MAILEFGGRVLETSFITRCFATRRRVCISRYPFLLRMGYRDPAHKWKWIRNDAMGMVRGGGNVLTARWSAVPAGFFAGGHEVRFYDWRYPSVDKLLHDIETFRRFGVVCDVDPSVFRDGPAA